MYTVFFYGISKEQQKDVTLQDGPRLAFEHKEDWVKFDESNPNIRLEWFDTPAFGTDRIIIKDPRDGIPKVYDNIGVFNVPLEGYRLLIAYESVAGGDLIRNKDISKP